MKNERKKETYEDLLPLEDLFALICQVDAANRQLPTRAAAWGGELVAHDAVAEGAADNLVSEADADDSHASLLQNEVTHEADEALDPCEVFKCAMTCSRTRRKSG